MTSSRHSQTDLATWLRCADRKGRSSVDRVSAFPTSHVIGQQIPPPCTALLGSKSLFSAKAEIKRSKEQLQEAHAAAVGLQPREQMSTCRRNYISERLAAGGVEGTEGRWIVGYCNATSATPSRGTVTSKPFTPSSREKEQKTLLIGLWVSLGSALSVIIGPSHDLSCSGESREYDNPCPDLHIL